MPMPSRKVILFEIAACLLVGAVAFGGTLAYRSAEARPSGKLYVADTFGDDVGVIDAATGEKRTQLKTGKLPHNFALTADKKILYVSESGSQSVTAFDTTTDTPIKQAIVGRVPDIPEHRAIGLEKVRSASSCKTCHLDRPVGSFISGVTLTADERHLLVTEMKTSSVNVVDAKTLVTERQVEVLTPEGSTPSNLLVHPKTREIYVLSRLRKQAKTKAVAGAAGLGGFDHDGGRGNSFVVVYDPTFTRPVATMKAPYSVPYGAVFSPDGDELYVTYRSTNKIAAFDLTKKQLARSYDVHEAPIGLLLLPDGETLMCANFYQSPSTVQFVDRKTGTIKHTLEVPSSPTLMVRHPKTGLVYLTSSGANKIIEIDPSVPAVTRQFDAGAYPIDIQLVP